MIYSKIIDLLHFLKMSLLQVFEETCDSSIADSTYRTYEYGYSRYLKVIQNINEADPPEPVTLKNVQLFCAHRKLSDITYNTLCNELSSISYYCKQNGWQDVTRDVSIQKFKKGFVRLTGAGSCPYAVQGLSIEQIKDLLNIIDYDDIKEIFTGCHIIIQFFGIMRISEVLSLKNKDITYFTDIEGKEGVKIFIKKTKTDQDGVGRLVTIFANDDMPQKINLIKMIHNEQAPEKFLFLNERTQKPFSQHCMRNRFLTLLLKAGMIDERYSTHSLRKGGANHLAKHHAAIESIKYQGGWESSRFLLYTAFDDIQTAADIKDKFN